jgi:hypothetical protein
MVEMVTKSWLGLDKPDGILGLRFGVLLSLCDPRKQKSNAKREKECGNYPKEITFEECKEVYIEKKIASVYQREPLAKGKEIEMETAYHFGLGNFTKRFSNFVAGRLLLIRRVILGKYSWLPSVKMEPGKTKLIW